MTTQSPTKWAHLPNAAHIDRVIAHAKANPAKWDAALDAACDAACDAAWSAAWDAVLDATRDAARDAARVAARDASRGAVAALVAWDEAGELLNQPPEVVRFLADEGVHAAVLLYTAVLAMQEDK